MRQTVFSSQAAQREYVIKHHVGKKEIEYMDIQDFLQAEEITDRSHKGQEPAVALSRGNVRGQVYVDAKAAVTLGHSKDAILTDLPCAECEEKVSSHS
ncbi:hypothetical protein ABVT39_019069 [Epinephelus coioides]